jgi:hypothetical protein
MRRPCDRTFTVYVSPSREEWSIQALFLLFSQAHGLISGPMEGNGGYICTRGCMQPRVQIRSAGKRAASGEYVERIPPGSPCARALRRGGLPGQGSGSVSFLLSGRTGWSKDPSL